MAAIAREILDYDELIQLCRQRKKELQLSNVEVDEIAGFSEMGTNKLLGPRRYKHLGRVSAPLLFGALGIRLFLLEDPGATAKPLARRTPRQDQYDTTHKRQALQIAPPAPPTYEDANKACPKIGQGGGNFRPERRKRRGKPFDPRTASANV
jgi:hypothetical protein